MTDAASNSSPGERIVYLMRGLPSCGKSRMARHLAGESGVICETDAYFYTHVGDDPRRYDYRTDLLPIARRWNHERFRRAVDAGRSPVIVDRGNSLAEESAAYARYAVERGYRVELAEPDSPWWQELRVLLKYKEYTWPVLEWWADRLAELSRQTHRVPAATIRDRMRKWKHDLTVDDLLALAPERSQADGSTSQATSRNSADATTA